MGQRILFVERFQGLEHHDRRSGRARRMIFDRQRGAPHRNQLVTDIINQRSFGGQDAGRQHFHDRIDPFKRFLRSHLLRDPTEPGDVTEQHRHFGVSADERIGIFFNFLCDFLSHKLLELCPLGSHRPLLLHSGPTASNAGCHDFDQPGVEFIDGGTLGSKFESPVAIDCADHITSRVPNRRCHHRHHRGDTVRDRTRNLSRCPPDREFLFQKTA